MGNCATICKNLTHGIGDVNIEKMNKAHLDYIRQVYSSPNNLKKIIFIQINVKKFLKRIKHHEHNKFRKKLINCIDSQYKEDSQIRSINHIKKKEDFETGVVNCIINIHKENIYPDSPLLSNNQKSHHTKSEKHLKNSSNHNSKKESKNKESKQSKSKFKNYDEEFSGDSLVIPTIKVGLLNKKIFEQDQFLMGIRNNQDIENDPRDAPHDGIRKKYPKIVEDLSAYEGEWKDGKRDGFGILFWGEESKFIGYFEDNKVFGYGKLWHEDGDIYKGDWKDFKAEGYGLYLTKKGAYFKGEWENDRQHGYGSEKWPRGSKFEGEYFEGDKQGIGILHFEEKAGYEGEFEEGIICGIGTFYFGEGRKYQGQWLNNKMHGYGSIIWQDGNFFEGSFYEDKKEGFGIFYTHKKVYMGNWKSNKLEGIAIIIENNKIKKQIWANGRAYKNLPDDTSICFEKYAESFLKKLKKRRSAENI